MKILDGKKISDEIAVKLGDYISGCDDASKPKLVIIQVGHVPASDIYIGMKVKYADKIGAIVEVRNFDDSVSENELLAEVEKINQDQNVHGAIVQLPIPKQINLEKVLNSISPEKDVDGLGALNISKLVRAGTGGAEKGIVPATARGIVDLLNTSEIQIAGKNIVVVGRSVLVGKSTAFHLLNQDATVTICHSQTQDLAEKTKKADILITAAGTPNLITADHITADQIVVDVSISVDSDGQVVGDLVPDIISDKLVKVVSPVPGGVGPMTVASLFQNLVETYTNQI